MSNENLSPEESLAANGESFYWAKKFLGKKVGEDSAHLYAFCRLLDDMADGDIENGPKRLISIQEKLQSGEGPTDSALTAFLPLLNKKNSSSLISLSYVPST